MSNKPILYVARDAAGFMEMSVLRLVVVGLPISNPDAPVLANHWRIHAVIKDGSIVIDMAPGGDGVTGLLQLNYRPYDVSNQAVCSAVLQLQVNCTVNALVGCLLEGKLDRYVFTSNGDGCRNWIRVAIDWLERQGLISAGSLRGIDAIISFLYLSNTERVPSVPGVGTFY